MCGLEKRLFLLDTTSSVYAQENCMTRSITEIRTDLTFYKNSKVNWQKAFDAIALGGQSYELRDGDTTRQLTRANLPEIRNTLTWIDGKIADLERELANATGNTQRSNRIIFLRGVK